MIVSWRLNHDSPLIFSDTTVIKLKCYSLAQPPTFPQFLCLILIILTGLYSSIYVTLARPLFVLPNKSLHDLQLLQNSAAPIRTGPPSRSHYHSYSAASLVAHRILGQLYESNSCVSVPPSPSPPYLHLATPSYSLTSSSASHLVVPLSRLVTRGSRAFSRSKTLFLYLNHSSNHACSNGVNH